MKNRFSRPPLISPSGAGASSQPSSRSPTFPLFFAVYARKKVDHVSLSRVAWRTRCCTADFRVHGVDDLAESKKSCAHTYPSPFFFVAAPICTGTTRVTVVSFLSHGRVVARRTSRYAAVLIERAIALRRVRSWLGIYRRKIEPRRFLLTFIITHRRAEMAAPCKSSARHLSARLAPTYSRCCAVGHWQFSIPSSKIGKSTCRTYIARDGVSSIGCRGRSSSRVAGKTRYVA